jgi:uncharacterized membrane protein
MGAANPGFSMFTTYSLSVHSLTGLLVGWRPRRAVGKQTMKIWQKLVAGLLVIIGLMTLITLFSVSLSGQVWKLRNIELPMEQNLREVEVSIWEAIHAANAFQTTCKPT